MATKGTPPAGTRQAKNIFEKVVDSVPEWEYRLSPPSHRAIKMNAESWVDEYSIPVTETGCLLWLGFWSEKGYGQLRINGKIKRAHRESYERSIGPIPKGLCVCHSCDVPACINPSHLWVGTHKKNMEDRSSKGRYAGIWNGRSVLTEQEVRAIRFTEIGTIKEIASKYGISKSAVSAIINNISWTHIL